MHEVAVRGAVRSGYVHVRFGDGDRVGDSRQHHGHACAQHHAKLLARHQTASFVLLPVVFKMILITHSPSTSARHTVEHRAISGYYTESFAAAVRLRDW